MSKRVGLVLSGCGVYDGSEIHESVLALLALTKQGFKVQCLAPNIPQAHVVNHLEGAPAEGESRNVLVESARIARGNVKDLAKARAADYDALFFPGGFGAAKNLCSLAFDGPRMKVEKSVEKIVRAMHAAGKPMVFVCVSPVIAARVIGEGVEVTVGCEKDIAKVNKGVSPLIPLLGGTHIDKQVHQAHIDKANKIVTAPAYMYDASIVEIEKSIVAAVKGLAKLMGE